MSDYNKITDYSAKDALLSGDPVKRVKGSEIGADFDAVAVAVATKADSASPVFTGVSGFAVGAVGAPSIYMTGYATTGWYNIGANNWGFAVSGAKVLDVSSTGLAVTGTLSATGASSLARIDQSNGIIDFSSLGNGSTSWQIGTVTAGKPLDIFIGGSVRAQFSDTGLAVTGTAASGIISTLVGSTNFGFRFTTSSTGAFEQLLSVGGGEVLALGVNHAAVAKISSTGLAVTGTLSATGTSSLERIDQSNGSITFASLGNGSTSWQIGTQTALKPLDIFIGGSVMAQFSDTGLAVTGTTSTTTGMAVGGATAGAGGIAFPATAVAVADANTLDDYEEGTFTPVLSFGGASVGIAGTFTGTYTKIGRVVTANAQVSLSNKGSSVGIAVISGIPFSAAVISPIILRYRAINTTLGIQGYVGAAGSDIVLELIDTTGSAGGVLDTNFTNTSSLEVTIVYHV